MNAMGLSPAELDLIRGVLKNHPAVTGAILFGSRAKGTAQPASDIDLALEGIADALQAEAIASELDELPLPYRFDVVALTSVQSAQLRAHIERVGVAVYEQDSTMKSPA
jgi:predicted nucleotidyltransferase